MLTNMNNLVTSIPSTSQRNSEMASIEDKNISSRFIDFYISDHNDPDRTSLLIAGYLRNNFNQYLESLALNIFKNINAFISLNSNKNALSDNQFDLEIDGMIEKLIQETPLNILEIWSTQDYDEKTDNFLSCCGQGINECDCCFTPQSYDSFVTGSYDTNIYNGYDFFVSPEVYDENNNGNDNIYDENYEINGAYDYYNNNQQQANQQYGDYSSDHTSYHTDRYCYTPTPQPLQPNFECMSIGDIMDRNYTIQQLSKFKLIYRLCVDRDGSRYIQRLLLRKGSKTNENIFVILNYFKQENIDLINLSCNKYGNYIMSLLLRLSNEPQKEFLVNNLILKNQVLLKLCLSPPGCRVIQTALSVLDKEKEKYQKLLNKLIQCLEKGKDENNRKFFDLFICQNGNHVIQKIVELNLPYDQIKFIGDTLQDNIGMTIFFFYCKRKNNKIVLNIYKFIF